MSDFKYVSYVQFKFSKINEYFYYAGQESNNKFVVTSHLLINIRKKNVLIQNESSDYLSFTCLRF